MSDKKIDVIFCTDGIFPHAVGGMQRHSRLLSEALAESGDINLTVLHPHNGISVFNNPSVKEVSLEYDQSSGRYLVDCYRYSKKVYEYVKAHPNAVVYSQGLAVWYRIGDFRNRVIVNPHGLEPWQTLSMRDYFTGSPFRIIFRYLFKNANRVVSLGGRLTGILQRIAGAKKVVVLSNAVNIPPPVSRKFDTDKPLRFLFAGRFALNKGINILAEAVSELNREGYQDKFIFDLVGKGPLYEDYVKKYNYPNLIFHGFASDEQLNSVYRDDDVFVLPTLFEGMPTVVLEAMAHGMPIIVTDVGATLEMVDATNGFIIEKNDVKSLKKAILQYYNLKAEEKQKLSEASYNKVKERFSWTRVAAEHTRLFARVRETM